MLEIRIHGRGGQGVVTAAELISVAAFDEGLRAQAFPTFGSERTGAPVVSFCRIDQEPIRLREPIGSPDVVIVQDPTLVHQVNLFEGLGADGYLLVNTSQGFAELGLDELVSTLRPERALTLPATAIARERLGKPLPNAAMLGGFAALTEAVSIDSVERAICDRFAGAVGERNAAAARAAFDLTERELRAHAHA